MAKLLDEQGKAADQQNKAGQEMKEFVDARFKSMQRHMQQHAAPQPEKKGAALNKCQTIPFFDLRSALAVLHSFHCLVSGICSFGAQLGYGKAVLDAMTSLAQQKCSVALCCLVGRWLR